MDTTQITKDINTDNQSSSEVIKSDIDHTRQRMDETISELGDRLHPKNIISDLIEYVRSSPSADGHSLAEDAQKAAKAVLRQVQLHPVPSLLLTAGVVWLITEQRRKTTYSGDYEIESYRVGGTTVAATCAGSDNEDLATTQAATTKPGMMGSVREAGAKVGEKLSAASESVKSAAGSVKDSLGSVKDTISSAANATVESGRHLKVRAGETMDRVKNQVQRGYEASRDSYRRNAENYPLAMGVGCLALGVLVGFLLPRTQREDELMGEASAQVLDKTKEMGNKVIDRTKQVANEVVDKVVGEAQTQGLTPSNLVNKVGQVASAAGDTIKEKVQNEASHIKSAANTGSSGPQTGNQPAPKENVMAGAGSGCGCGSV